MICRAVDQNNDWTFGRGLNNYLQNNAAIAQDINTRLGSFVGDCFFDLSSGINWFNLLGNSSQLPLQLAIAAVILNTAGVTGILQLSLNFNHTSRLFTLSYSVSTIYSVTSSKFSLYANQ